MMWISKKELDDYKDRTERRMNSLSEKVTELEVMVHILNRSVKGLPNGLFSFGTVLGMEDKFNAIQEYLGITFDEEPSRVVAKKKGVGRGKEK